MQILDVQKFMSLCDAMVQRTPCSLGNIGWQVTSVCAGPSVGGYHIKISWEPSIKTSTVCIMRKVEILELPDDDMARGIFIKQYNSMFKLWCAQRRLLFTKHVRKFTYEYRV